MTALALRKQIDIHEIPLSSAEYPEWLRSIASPPAVLYAKGKLERWHRVVRDQFLSELISRHLQGLETLNSALWAWIESVYHQRHHSVLGCSPLSRWQRDLETVRERC